MLGLLKRSLICSLAYATESGGRENVIDRSWELQTCDVSLVCGEDKVGLAKTRLKTRTSLIRFLVEGIRLMEALAKNTWRARES